MEPESSLPYSQVPATSPYPYTTPFSHQTSSHFLKIRFNIILPTTSVSPQWSLSLRFSNQNPLYTYIYKFTLTFKSTKHIIGFD
jgi:hypothetical protein